MNFASNSLSHFPFQMPVCHLTPPSRVTGVTWHTGSTGRGWAASIRCTSPPSAFSMTYLKARASVSASWAWISAVAPCSGRAGRSATACSSAKSRTGSGPTTAVSTPSSSTRLLWTYRGAAAWWCARWCPDTPSRCSTTNARLYSDRGRSLSCWTDRMTRTACASASPRAGALVTLANSSPLALAGSRSSSATTDNTRKHARGRTVGLHKLSQISST